jgi:hypothetical protein
MDELFVLFFRVDFVDEDHHEQHEWTCDLFSLWFSVDEKTIRREHDDCVGTLLDTFSRSFAYGIKTKQPA